MTNLGINSEKYWEDKFSSDWDEKGGRSQTRFFTEVFLACMPKSIKRDIKEKPYSIADVSCGEGDSLPILRKEFSRNRLKGYDFSESAIKKAKENYPDFDFEIGNIFSTQYREDVMLCSNTLEHFREPWKAFESLASSAPKYIFILIPFLEKQTAEEAGGVTEEHFAFFDAENIPSECSSYKLIAYKAIDTRYMGTSQWFGNQILLCYAPATAENNAVVLNPQVLEEQMADETVRLNIDTSSNESIKSALRELYHIKSENHERYVRLQKAYASYEKLNNDYELIRKQLKNEIQNSAQLVKRIELLEGQAQRNGSLEATCAALTNHVEAITSATGYKVLQRFYRLSEKNKLIRACGRAAKRVANCFRKGTPVPVVMETEGKYENFLKRLSDESRREHCMNLLKEVEEVIDAYEGEYVFLFPPLVDWNIPLFQRPQQMAMSYGRQGILYLYSTPNGQDQVSCIQRVDENCYVVDSVGCIIALIEMIMQKGKRLIYNVYSTDNFASFQETQKIEGLVDRIVYEYIDEISSEISGIVIPEDTYKRHDYMLANENIITVASADKLWHEVLAKRPSQENIVMVTNGADIQHFAVSKNDAEYIPNELKAIVGQNRPIIGYYGALATWLDTKLITYVSKERPNYNYVLIGPMYHNRKEIDDLEKLPNVYLLGAVNYNILPRYACWFDVATIPFIVNEITESTSPIKVFEYMALQKPIVTTYMPECTKYDSVMVASTYEEYVEMLDRAISLKNDPEMLHLLRKEANENSWDRKAADVFEAVKKADQ